MRYAILLALALSATTGCKKKGGSEWTDKMKGFADQACKCTTQDCLTKVAKDVATVTSELGGKAMDKDEAESYAAATKAYTDCVGKKTQELAGAAGSGSGNTMAGSGSGNSMAGSGSGNSMAGSAGSNAGSGSAEPSMAGSGSGSGAADSALEGTHHAGNCPSMVLGATTTAEVKGKDVLVHIASDDKDAIVTIQKRAGELVKEKADDTAVKAEHDQKGSHGGARGLCPVHYAPGGKAVAKNDPKGVTITITPKEKPEDLLKEINDRIPKAADWVKANIKAGDKENQGGVGGGSGAHGGNHSGKGDGHGKDKDKGGAGSATKAAGSATKAAAGSGGGW